MYRKTVLKINVDNYIKNANAFINHTGKKLMGIVKANAYGLVDYVMAEYLEKSGVDFFGVSSIEEALSLRNHGIKSEILVLSYAHDLEICKKNNLSVIIPNKHFINEYKDKLEGLKVHIKINTGLNRLGILPNEVKDVLNELLSYKTNVKGIMTHFACTDNKELTQKHYELFKSSVESCDYKFEYIHTSATDAAIFLKDDISNYIRIGLGLLGVANIDDEFPFSNVATLNAEVIDCKKINKGEGVSYHHNYVSDGEGYYLTCAIGYADGIDLRYSGKEVYINGEVGTIVGNICMDLLIVKVNNPYTIGSEIEIIGEHMPIKRRVNEIGNNACKIITDLSDRITRQYYKDGKLVKEIESRFK